MSEKYYDLIIVGAGHAGCEAAWAATGMGLKTALVTLRKDRIAAMSCNPAIGGLAKGHVVKEIDALGGLMGWITDRAAIQFRTLNKSRGLAVQAPRAQCDKSMYSRLMRETLEERDGLDIVEAEVRDLDICNGQVRGVHFGDSAYAQCSAVILTTGTFLDGLIHIGKEKERAGRIGEAPSIALAKSLRDLGFEVGRLKTGTPPRLLRDSIDWSGLEEQPPDTAPDFFSWRTEKAVNPQLSCFLTYTNPEVHQVLHDNLHRSPMYSGEIVGTGPRYCPSIEDKVVKFPDRDRHQIFLEPEGLDTDWIYPNGISTSMPRDVQLAFLRKIAGLENVEMVRPGYAVEYNFVQPTQLKPTLETKAVTGLYCAGQICGTSGYEEAAGQGFVAGVNAALKYRCEPPFILGRNEAYIGVLVDDLVTRGVSEPYRLFTSRAEYRLLLDAGSADERLTPHGHRLGLVGKPRFESVELKYQNISQTVETLSKIALNPSRELRAKLRIHFNLDISSPTTAAELLKRPGVSFDMLADFLDIPLPDLTETEKIRVHSQINYAGYLKHERERVEKLKRDASLLIPTDFDYQSIPGLTHEAIEQLSAVRPVNLAQAGRVPGITPATLSLVAIYIRKRLRAA